MTDPEFIDAIQKAEELERKYLAANMAVQALNKAYNAVQEERDSARDEFYRAVYLACGGPGDTKPDQAAGQKRTCLIRQDGHIVELSAASDRRLSYAWITRKRIEVTTI